MKNKLTLNEKYRWLELNNKDHTLRIDITPLEIKIIKILLDEKVHTYDEICKGKDSRYLSVAISRLNKKLDDICRIKNKSLIGYYLEYLH